MAAPEPAAAWIRRTEPERVSGRITGSNAVTGLPEMGPDRQIKGGLMMNEPFELEALDVDGAIRETAERVDSHTRSALRRAGLGVGVIVGGGSLLEALPGLASGAATSDTDILNFALTLEHLELAFYAEAVNRGSSGETKTFARVVAGHEAAHVAALKGALGKAAVAMPKFDFKGTT